MLPGAVIDRRIARRPVEAAAARRRNDAGADGSGHECSAVEIETTNSLTGDMRMPVHKADARDAASISVQIRIPTKPTNSSYPTLCQHSIGLAS